MAAMRKEGKDTILFVSKEDHATPSKITLPEPEPGPGLLLPNGDINWNCPCLGGMATGPCGLEFRDAFSCFHYSKADPKGSDCYETFKTMQTCMSGYPAVYGSKDADMDDMALDEPTSTSSIEDSESKSAVELKNSASDGQVERTVTSNK